MSSSTPEPRAEAGDCPPTATARGLGGTILAQIVTISKAALRATPFAAGNDEPLVSRKNWAEHLLARGPRARSLLQAFCKHRASATMSPYSA